MTTAKVVLETFTRRCGHPEKMIHTVGDDGQANHYRATNCTRCGAPAITFGKGWGR